MNLFTFIFAAIIAASFTSVEAGKIDHDKVQPFAQPTPVTATEKAAVRFKPSLEILKGCHPYPAVNAAGETSAGVKGTGKPDGKCKGSSLGSQVYGRVDQYENKWAIMYSWYFPKVQGFWSWIGGGHRHKWAHVVVWLDDAELENPEILAVSVDAVDGTSIDSCVKGDSICDECVVGSTPQVSYQPKDIDMPSYHMLSLTGFKGEFQDLVIWEQMAEEARRALTDTDFGKDARVPFIDVQFENNLMEAHRKL